MPTRRVVARSTAICTGVYECASAGKRLAKSSNGRCKERFPVASTSLSSPSIRQVPCGKSTFPAQAVSTASPHRTVADSTMSPPLVITNSSWPAPLFDTLKETGASTKIGAGKETDNVTSDFLAGSTAAFRSSAQSRPCTPCTTGAPKSNRRAATGSTCNGLKSPDSRVKALCSASVKRCSANAGTSGLSKTVATETEVLVEFATNALASVVYTVAMLSAIGLRICGVDHCTPQGHIQP